MVNTIVTTQFLDHVTGFADLVKAASMSFQASAELPADLVTVRSGVTPSGAYVQVFPSPAFLRWLADYIESGARAG